MLKKDDLTKRRPRFRRVAPSEQPRFRLQLRDREIISLVHDYRLIPTGHILRLIPGSDQKKRRRLQALYHGDYIDRISLGMNEEIGYALANRGANVLADMGKIERGRTDWSQKNRQVTERFIAHTLMRTDFRAILTLALRTLPDIRIKLWLPDGTLRDEVVVDYRKAPVVPDDYFILEHQGNNAHSFDEADQSSMSGRRFARKIKAYIAWWREGKSREKLNAEFFRVFTLTKSRERRDNLCRIAQEVCRREEDPNASWLFWFGSATDYSLDNSTSVLDAIWRVPADEQSHMLLE